MANTPDLDQLKKDVEDKAQAAVAALQAAQKAVDDHSAADAALRTARTASLDQTVVQQAREWGLNPDNFEDEAGLKEAVDTASKTRTQAEVPAEAPKPGVMTEGDAAPSK